MGMMMYFPMFLQGVQDISTTQNGFIVTPYNVLTALMGIPVGYIIARSGRFKWMYIGGYGILTLSMFGLVIFNAGVSIVPQSAVAALQSIVDTAASLFGSDTIPTIGPVFVWSISLALLAGFGYGFIPTVNTIVIQNAVPKRLMGAAMGAIFFFLMMGSAISPVVLDSAMKVSYSKVLSQSLPEELHTIADSKTMEALDDPQVLLSGSAMEDLKQALQERDGNSAQLIQKTVDATRNALETGNRTIFWISALLMLFAFCLICTVPGNSMSKAE
jgi:MFS family permease